MKNIQIQKSGFSRVVLIMLAGLFTAGVVVGIQISNLSRHDEASLSSQKANKSAPDAKTESEDKKDEDQQVDESGAAKKKEESSPGSSSEQADQTKKEPPKSVSMMYKILSDDAGAQVSPTYTIISSTSGVELTVNLQCSTRCQFKLVSDDYTFTNTTTYSSTQKIKYLIDKPGTYILYNQYQPNVKTKLVIS